MEKLFEQGDVLLFSNKEIPKGAKKLKGSVLHHGATGNHHKLSGNFFSIYELNGKKFLKTARQTKLTHEEHKPLIIPKGTYSVEFVQEKDHFSDLIRQVVD